MARPQHHFNKVESKGGDESTKIPKTWDEEIRNQLKPIQKRILAVKKLRDEIDIKDYIGGFPFSAMGYSYALRENRMTINRLESAYHQKYQRLALQKVDALLKTDKRHHDLLKFVEQLTNYLDSIKTASPALSLRSSSSSLSFPSSASSSAMSSSSSASHLPAHLYSPVPLLTLSTLPKVPEGVSPATKELLTNISGRITQLQAVQSKYSDLSRQFDAAQRNVLKAFKELRVAQTEIRRHKQKNDDYVTELSGKISKISDLEGRLSSDKETFDEKLRNEQLKTSEQKTLCDTLGTEKASLEREIKKYKEDLGQINKTLLTLKEATTTRANKLLEKQTSLEASMKKLAKTLLQKGKHLEEARNALKTQRSSFETEARRQRDSMATTAQQILYLTNERNNLQDVVLPNLRIKQEAAENKVRELGKLHREKETRIKQLESLLSRQNTEIERLRAQIQSVASGELDSVRQNLAEVVARESKLGEENTRLGGVVLSLKTQLERLRDSLTKETKQKAELQGILTALRPENATLKKQKEELDKLLAERLLALTAANARVTQGAEALALMAPLRDALRVSITTLSEEKLALTNRVSHLEIENKRLSDENTDVKRVSEARRLGLTSMLGRANTAEQGLVTKETERKATAERVAATELALVGKERERKTAADKFLTTESARATQAALAVKRGTENAGLRTQVGGLTKRVSTLSQFELQCGRLKAQYNVLVERHEYIKNLTKGFLLSHNIHTSPARDKLT